MQNFCKKKFELPSDEDPSGYIVSAKIPAISAEGDAISQFQYLMKYPPIYSEKMMLIKLDQLVAQTKSNRRGFYVIEIKEAPDTRYGCFVSPPLRSLSSFAHSFPLSFLTKKENIHQPRTPNPHQHRWWNSIRHHPTRPKHRHLHRKLYPHMSIPDPSSIKCWSMARSLKTRFILFCLRYRRRSDHRYHIYRPSFSSQSELFWRSELICPRGNISADSE